MHLRGNHGGRLLDHYLSDLRLGSDGHLGSSLSVHTIHRLSEKELTVAVFVTAFICTVVYHLTRALSRAFANFFFLRTYFSRTLPYTPTFPRKIRPPYALRKSAYRFSQPLTGGEHPRGSCSPCFARRLSYSCGRASALFKSYTVHVRDMLITYDSRTACNGIIPVRRIGKHRIFFERVLYIAVDNAVKVVRRCTVRLLLIKRRTDHYVISDVVDDSEQAIVFT